MSERSERIDVTVRFARGRTPTTEAGQPPTSAPSNTALLTHPITATPQLSFATLLRVELRKATDTRSGRWLLALIVGLSVLALGWALAHPADGVSFANYGGGMAGVVAFLAPIIGLLAMTAECTQRTALTTFTLAPRRGQVLAAFDAAGVPSSPYRTVKEVLADPQLAHRGALTQVKDRGGAFNVLNPPFRLSGAPVQVAGFASGLGQQTREILELAGYAADEIEKMQADGTVIIGE